MKEYTKPVAEKVDFEFKNQVVASGCQQTTILKLEAGGPDYCNKEGSSTINS